MKKIDAIRRIVGKQSFPWVGVTVFVFLGFTIRIGSHCVCEFM